MENTLVAKLAEIELCNMQKAIQLTEKSEITKF